MNKLWSPHLEKIEEDVYFCNTVSTETKLRTLIFQNSLNLKLMKENVA